MKKSIKILKGLTVLLTMSVLVALCVGYSFADIYNFIASIYPVAGGAMIAVAPAGSVIPDVPVDTETAAAAAPDLLRPDISKRITQMKPSLFPMDTLIREAGGHESTNSWEFKWYSSDVRDTMDTISSAVPFVPPQTKDPNKEYQITVSKPNIWQVDDNIFVNNVLGGDGKELVLHIVKKETGGKLSVIPVNPLADAEASDIPAIAASTKLTRIGNAKAEKDAKTSPFGLMPFDSSNYTQIHMCQVEESFYEKIHNKEVQWDARDIQALSLFDLRRSMELTSLFGAKAKIFDPEGNDYKYMSGGITRFIKKGVQYTSGKIDDKTFNNWAKIIFVGNSGADLRYCFVGSDLMEELSNVPTIQKQLAANSTEVVYGITFSKVQTNFGNLLFKHHVLLNDAGWADKGVVVDMNNINKRVHQPMQTRKLNLKETGTSNVDAYVIEETFGLETRYADTHCIISKAA